MLTECHDCLAIISDDCDSCPWCDSPRQPAVTHRPPQFGLIGFLAFVTLVGVWLGIALRDTLR